MVNWWSNNDTVENAISPRNNQPTLTPSARKEIQPKTKPDEHMVEEKNTNLALDIILSSCTNNSSQIKKYKLIYFDFTGRAEIIR